MDNDEFINLLHDSDLIKVELNRLENEVRGANAARSVGFFEICSWICSISTGVITSLFVNKCSFTQYNE
ncbi:hypothetical protein M0R45_026749 [Rubus argutus]|uniref:Uncharacterized protein n=1 Tax=Rubus argutus TaxID=59490 RepID=A0AAW1WZQ5_RUBAR